MYQDVGVTDAIQMLRVSKCVEKSQVIIYN